MVKRREHRVGARDLRNQRRAPDRFEVEAEMAKDDDEVKRGERAERREDDVLVDALRAVVADQVMSRHLKAAWRRLGQLLGVDEKSSPVVKN